MFSEFGVNAAQTSELPKPSKKRANISGSVIVGVVVELHNIPSFVFISMLASAEADPVANS